MKKFNPDFRIGTKVMIGDHWCKITEIDANREWIKVDRFHGKYFRNHVLQYQRF